MGHKDPAYVIFDGDEDSWAYRFMRGWKANEHIDFDFRDAHNLDTMTSRAQDEEYVKRNLRVRLKQSSIVIVLVGEKTKNLYKFIRWELDAALELGLPIVVVNLNGKRALDADLCPPIIRSECAVHVDFKLKAIKHAMDYWPAEFRNLDALERENGARQYSDAQHSTWGN